MLTLNAIECKRLYEVLVEESILITFEERGEKSVERCIVIAG